MSRPSQATRRNRSSPRGSPISPIATSPRRARTRRSTNPSFEPFGGHRPPTGWRLAGNAATAELDAANPQDGTTSIYFRNDGQFAALESDAFAMPPTGQLAMTVHVRDQKTTSGAELRMVFEATHAGHVIAGRRSWRPATAASPAPGEWQSKAILVNDLPLESRGEMRVRFELSGPGEVWLDNVKLYDLLFPLKFYKYEGAKSFSSCSARMPRRRRLRPVELPTAFACSTTIGCDF